MPRNPLPARNTSRFFRRFPWLPSLLYVAVALFFLLLPRWLASPGTAAVSYSDFVKEIRADHLQRVVITPTQLVGIRKPDQVKGRNVPPAIVATRLPDVDHTELLRELEEHHITIAGEMNSGAGIGTWLMAWLPFVFF